MGRGAGEETGAGEWRPLSGHIQLIKLCVLWPHLPGGREAFFSPAQKGHCGPGRAPAGRAGLHWSSGNRGEGRKRPTRIQGDGEKWRDQESRRPGGCLPWGCLGDVRLSPALDDSDGVTGLHPQSTWLCDLPHTASLRKPSLWRQKKKCGWAFGLSHKDDKKAKERTFPGIHPSKKCTPGVSSVPGPVPDTPLQPKVG